MKVEQQAAFDPRMSHVGQKLPVVILRKLGNAFDFNHNFIADDQVRAIRALERVAFEIRLDLVLPSDA